MKIKQIMLKNFANVNKIEINLKDDVTYLIGSIDKENREKLFKNLVDAGFQVVAEYVDTKRQKDHTSILLSESNVI